MASYNQNKTRGNWLLASDCSTVAANQDYRGIQEATATAMTVEMDVNDNCTEDNDPICMRNYTGNLNPNEVIRYNASDAFRMGNYSLLGSVGTNIAREFLSKGPHILFSSLHLSRSRSAREPGFTQ